MENCLTTVFSVYVTAHGQAWADFDVYLPERWVGDPARHHAAGIPGSETALDELKTHQRGPRVVLRSRTPDAVCQEIYGYLCVHYAIRWLMHTVALEAGTDPDRLSFTRTLRAAWRTTASHPGFSLSGA